MRVFGRQVKKLKVARSREMRWKMDMSCGVVSGLRREDQQCCSTSHLFRIGRITVSFDLYSKIFDVILRNFLFNKKIYVSF